MNLDAVDLKILTALQQDGRISNLELADKVFLSPPACLRRVRLLEEGGIISRYSALLDANASRKLLAVPASDCVISACAFSELSTWPKRKLVASPNCCTRLESLPRSACTPDCTSPNLASISNCRLANEASAAVV